MKTATRVLAQSVYGLFGAGFLAVGASALLVNTGLLPEALRGAILDESQGNLDILHILQEFGSLLVFAGLVTFWFLGHYERSQAFHWSLTAFWGLLALVHWIDVRGPNPSIGGPLVTTVPFILFVAIGLLRAATEGDRGRAASHGSGGVPVRSAVRTTAGQ
jgi:hypothetical protein